MQTKIPSCLCEHATIPSRMQVPSSFPLNWNALPRTRNHSQTSQKYTVSRLRNNVSKWCLSSVKRISGDRNSEVPSRGGGEKERWGRGATTCMNGPAYRISIHPSSFLTLCVYVMFFLLFCILALSYKPFSENAIQVFVVLPFCQLLNSPKSFPDDTRRTIVTELVVGVASRGKRLFRSWIC